MAEALGSSGKGGGLEAHSPEAWEIHHGSSLWHLGARGEAADHPSRNGGNIEQCAGQWKPVLIQSTQLTAVWLFCPCATRGAKLARPQQPLDGVESVACCRGRRDQQLGGWSLAHVVLASSSRGSLTGKAEAELAAWEEAASLVSADLGTQQLLMDGVRPGQAPWEPQTIHYRPPVPHTASSGLGINLCLGSQRAKGEHSAA